eukprot:TRINITY_DN7962_c0_g1_i2.p1 TRINITY_DN7962_c0_g1~~TRINITY_DN7962_c0_g1_i2.p1  ORF type:complete len:190 (-),score=3.87 TRINITY_DN7962_c0_g1_i2:11-580(-)
MWDKLWVITIWIKELVRINSVFKWYFVDFSLGYIEQRIFCIGFLQEKNKKKKQKKISIYLQNLKFLVFSKFRSSGSLKLKSLKVEQKKIKKHSCEKMKRLFSSLLVRLVWLIKLVQFFNRPFFQIFIYLFRVDYLCQLLLDQILQRQRQEYCRIQQFQISNLLFFQIILYARKRACTALQIQGEKNKGG